MGEALQAYVKRVGELAEHVRGNEQATKPSLVERRFEPTVMAVLDNLARSEQRSSGAAAGGFRRPGTGWSPARIRMGRGRNGVPEPN
jgi:hypothetical protein